MPMGTYVPVGWVKYLYKYKRYKIACIASDVFQTYQGRQPQIADLFHHSRMEPLVCFEPMALNIRRWLDQKLLFGVNLQDRII